MDQIEQRKRAIIMVADNIMNCYKRYNTFTENSITNVKTKPELTALGAEINEIITVSDWFQNLSALARATNDDEVTAATARAFQWGTLKADNTNITLQLRREWGLIDMNTADENEPLDEQEQQQQQEQRQQQQEQQQREEHQQQQDQQREQQQHEEQIRELEQRIQEQLNLIGVLQDQAHDNVVQGEERDQLENELQQLRVRLEQQRREQQQARNQMPTPPQAQNQQHDQNEQMLQLTAMLTAVMMRNRPEINLDTLRSSSQNAAQWFDRFELKTANWTDADRATEAAKFFDEIALEKFQQLGINEKTNYKLLRPSMITKLRPPQHGYKAKALFYGAKQRPDENVERFSKRIKQYTDEVEISDQEKMKADLSEMFRQGCTPRIKTQLVLAPADMAFKDLVLKAKEIESILAEAETSSTINAIDTLDETVNALSKDAKCFNCRQLGHAARECPNKQTVESTTIITKPRPDCVFCGISGHYAAKCPELEKIKESLKSIKPVYTQSETTTVNERPSYYNRSSNYRPSPRYSNNQDRGSSSSWRNSSNQPHYNNNQDNNNSQHNNNGQLINGQQIPQLPQQQPPAKCQKCGQRGHVAYQCQSKN